MAKGEQPGPEFGLSAPPWIEDWGHISREHVGGSLGYTAISISYFALFEYVNENLPTRRRHSWQIVRKSDIGVGGSGAADEDTYVLMPEVVRTVFTASDPTDTDAKRELTRHVREVMINSPSISAELLNRQLLHIGDRLSPETVYINGVAHNGWRLDDFPQVTAFAAVAGQKRCVSLVIDQAFTSSVPLRLVDRTVTIG